MRARRSNSLLRLGAFILAAQAAVIGVWALFEPRSFFSDFPPLWGGWVAASPPYNEHLVRDLGGLYTAWAIVFLWLASTLDRVLLKVSMLAWLVFAIVHFIFHIAHADDLSGADLIAQMVGLGLVVVLPLAMLFAGRRRKGADFTWARNG
jgi:hypothetical protein